MIEPTLEVFTNEDGNVSAAMYFEDNIVLSACLSSEWIDEGIDDVHQHLSECSIKTFSVEHSIKPVDEILSSIAADSDGALILIDPSFVSTMDSMINIKRIQILED